MLGTRDCESQCEMTWLLPLADGERVFASILRRAVKPKEIAAAVFFPCTPHAGFITGEIMNVNGGAVLVR